jgi:hypothetical protein
MVASRHIAIALALLTALPAQAGILYKSIAPDGSVMFSDMPPAGNARLVETRIIGDRGPAQQQARAAAMAINDAERQFASDEAIARANAQLDQAEHDLAAARRDTWSPRDGLGMVPTRFTAEADQRIRVYRAAALAARQALMDLLRERRAAAIANPPEPGSPYVVSLVSIARP